MTKLLSHLSRLRRQPVVEPVVEPWPRNPRTVADDLRDSQANEAELAKQLVASRQRADVEAARASAFEQRAEAAEEALELARAKDVELHRRLREVTAERNSLRIATGTGQPRKA